MYSCYNNTKKSVSIPPCKKNTYSKISSILAKIFWDILMFNKIFMSWQVKRMAIISNKHGIYELPHELPNNLRLRTLGN